MGASSQTQNNNRRLSSDRIGLLAERSPTDKAKMKPDFCPTNEVSARAGRTFYLTICASVMICGYIPEKQFRKPVIERKEMTEEFFSRPAAAN